MWDLTSVNRDDSVPLKRDCSVRFSEDDLLIAVPDVNYCLRVSLLKILKQTYSKVIYNETVISPNSHTFLDKHCDDQCEFHCLLVDFWNNLYYFFSNDLDTANKASCFLKLIFLIYIVAGKKSV